MPPVVMADHAVHRQPLKPEQVVHDERTHHKRHGVEDVGRVILGVGRDGLRRAEEADDEVDMGQAEKSEDDARNERGEERRGGIRVGLLLVARAERPWLTCVPEPMPIMKEMA